MAVAKSKGNAAEIKFNFGGNEMKLFRAEFPGVWISGFAIIQAHDEEDATLILLRELKKNSDTCNLNIDESAVFLTEVEPQEDSFALIVFNGDY